MKRATHILLGLFAAALLLVCCAVLIAPRFIHSDRFKQNLETLLSQKLSRDVRITGSLAFRFFPWIGFKAKDLQVSNAEGFDKAPMVTCSMADVHLELIPLLKKRIVFKKIILADTTVRLIRNRFGKTNWSDLPSMGKASLKPRGGQPFVLDRIGEVNIRDSTLTYFDALRQTEVTMSNLELDRKGVVQRDFRLACDLMVKGRPVDGFTTISGHCDVTGNAYVDTHKERFAITGADVSFPFKLTGPHGRTTSGAIAAHLTGDTAKETLALTGTTVRIGNASASGDLHAEQLFHRPSASGRFEAASENIRELLTELNLEKFLTAWTPPSAAAVAFSYAADGQGLSLEDLTFQMDDCGLTGKLAIKDFHRPEISAVLIADRLDLDRLFPENAAPVSIDDSPSAGPGFDGWTLDLRLSVGQMSGRGFAIEDLDLHARAGDGRLECRPVAFAFAGGRVQGTIDAVALDPSMVAKVALRFDSIPAEALWQLAGQKSPVTARFNGEMNLITEGQRFADLAKSLSGTARIETPDGMVIRLNDQKPEETMDIARASAVLAAYVHEEKSGQDDDLVRSFTLDVSAEGRAPDLAGTFRTHGIARISSGLEWIAVSAGEFSTRLVGQELGVVSPLDLDGSGRYDSRMGNLFIDRFSFRGMGLTGSGRLQAARFASDPQFSGHLNVNNFDPRLLARRLGVLLPQGNDPMVFQHGKAEADFRFDSGYLLIEGMSAGVDITRLSGSVMLAGLPRPEIGLLLHGDRLDLDRYLPEKNDNRPDSDPHAAHKPPDRSGFKAQRIHADITFDQLKIADIRLERPDLSMDLVKGVIDLRLHSAALYGGAASGDAVLDAGSDPMHGSATLNLEAVDLSGLLADMFDWVPITGNGAMDLNLAGKGPDLPALARGLKGQARVTIAKGAIHGIRAVPDNIRKTDSGNTGVGNQEPFDRIQGTVVIENGVLKSTDGTLASPYIKADGTGSLNLFTDILDYAVTADIRGLPLVTYTFKGPLDDIQVSLDRAGFARETAKGILKSPFTLGKGTLGVGTDILDAGKDAIGDGSGPQRMGQAAFNVGRGILEIGKGIIGLDGKATETVGDGATEVGRGLLDVGKGAVDTGLDVLEGIGSGLQRLFSGKKGVIPAEEGSKPAPEPSPSKNGSQPY
ncbi:MAG: AsmA family protein [Desulfobacterales bacterium]|nr:AsmA family protein [Desulfobacterales bacterium]